VFDFDIGIRRVQAVQRLMTGESSGQFGCIDHSFRIGQCFNKGRRPDRSVDSR
jgi:hypothetical protein